MIAPAMVVVVVSCFRSIRGHGRSADLAFSFLSTGINNPNTQTPRALLFLLHVPVVHLIVSLVRLPVPQQSTRCACGASAVVRPEVV